LALDEIETITFCKPTAKLASFVDKMCLILINFTWHQLHTGHPECGAAGLPKQQWPESPRGSSTCSRVHLKIIYFSTLILVNLNIHKPASMQRLTSCAWWRS